MEEDKLLFYFIENTREKHEIQVDDVVYLLTTDKHIANGRLIRWILAKVLSLKGYRCIVDINFDYCKKPIGINLKPMIFEDSKYSILDDWGTKDADGNWSVHIGCVSRED